MIFPRHIRLETFAAFVIAVSLAGLPLAANAEPPAVKPDAKAAPKRVLFVGNSYLYYGDSLHNHVRRMAIAADPASEKAFKNKSATISGSALYDHNIQDEEEDKAFKGRMTELRPAYMDAIIAYNGSIGAAVSLLAGVGVALLLYLAFRSLRNLALV